MKIRLEIISPFMAAAFLVSLFGAIFCGILAHDLNKSRHENDSLKTCLKQYKANDSIWINYNKKLEAERTGDAKTITSDSCQKYHRKEERYKKTFDWKSK